MLRRNVINAVLAMTSRQRMRIYEAAENSLPVGRLLLLISCFYVGSRETFKTPTIIDPSDRLNEINITSTNEL